MAVSATWNATSGVWFSPGNWDEFDDAGRLVHYIPLAGNDVYLPDNSGTTPGTPFTVTYNGTSTINTLNGSVIGLVDMVGGKLTVLAGGGRIGLSVGSGAELSLSAGTLSIERGDFAGTVSGAGELRMVDGAYTIEAGARFTVATWIVTHQIGSGVVPTVTLATDFAYAGTFRFEDVFGNLPIFALGGHTLTLNGTAVLTGDVRGSGVMLVAGDDSTFSGAVSTGATLEVASELTQASRALIDGRLLVDSGATYEISVAANIDSTTFAGGRIGNNGTFLVSGAGTSTVNTTFANNGRIVVEDGSTLNLVGTANLKGVLAGAGTLSFGFAHDVTLNATTVGVDHIYINGGNGGGVARLARNLAYDGEFTFENAFGTFDLNGKVLTLSGDAAFRYGIVDGPGRLVLKGVTEFTSIAIGYGDTGQAAVIENAGRVEQSSFLQLKGSIINDQGAVWRIAQAGDINDYGGSFRNNGVLVVEGDGRSAMNVDFFNANTLTINAGSQFVVAVGESTLKGTIKGAGELAFGFAHDVSIETSRITVASMYFNGGNGGGTATIAKALAYDGDFIFENGFGKLVLDANLRLNGDVELRAGTITGDAGLTITGDAVFAFVTLDAAVTIAGDGSVLQTGNVYVLEDLTIGRSASYDMAFDNIYDFSAEGSITVNGLLERSVAGDGRIASVTSVAETGAVVVDAGSLTFTGGFTNLGVIEGVITQNGNAVTISADVGARRHLTGGAGDNRIDITGRAAAIIEAGAGDDTIAGGLGADTIRGGAGADVFLFDTAIGGKNVDRIVDFGGRDRVNLDHDVFTALKVGDLPASAFKDISAGRVDANDRILYEHTSGKLFYDADGRGGQAAVLIATFANEPRLDADDFRVV